ncbi:hypothetical protein, partial [Escherichia coli]|uniref:hypothetical protein n=1 Tax=Escherichia coli TaxID=562 RepID=UPI001BDCD778
LSTMLPTLQLLWLPVLISGLATPATDCNAVCELASCVAGAFLSAHQSAHQPQRKEHCMTFARTYASNRAVGGSQCSFLLCAPFRGANGG